MEKLRGVTEVATRRQGRVRVRVRGHMNRADDAPLVTCASRGPKGPLLQGLGSFQKPLLTCMSMSGKGAAGRVRLSQPIGPSGLSNSEIKFRKIKYFLHS